MNRRGIAGSCLLILAIVGCSGSAAKTTGAGAAGGRAGSGGRGGSGGSSIGGGSPVVSGGAGSAGRAAGTTGASGITGTAGTTGASGITGTAGTTSQGGASGYAGPSAGAGGAPGGAAGIAGQSGASGHEGASAGAGGAAGGAAGAPGYDPANKLSDFEDPTRAIIANVGTPARNGTWYSYNDESATCAQTPMNSLAYPTSLPPTPSPGPSGGRALHAVWSDCTTWGAGIGANISIPMVDGGVYSGRSVPYDLTAYTGLALWILVSPTADSKVRIEIPMIDEIPITDGGYCEESVGQKCGDSYGQSFTTIAPGVWTRLTVNFSDSIRFHQEGWGATFAWNPAHAVGIRIASLGAEIGESFDFWIDDVYLTK